MRDTASVVVSKDKEFFNSTLLCDHAVNLVSHYTFSLCTRSENDLLPTVGDLLLLIWVGRKMKGGARGQYSGIRQRGREDDVMVLRRQLGNEEAEGGERKA